MCVVSSAKICLLVYLGPNMSISKPGLEIVVYLATDNDPTIFSGVMLFHFIIGNMLLGLRGLCL